MKKKENQQLEIYYDLYSQTIPSLDVSCRDLVWTPCKGGKLSLGGQYFIICDNPSSAPADNQNNPPAKVKSVRVGFFKNQELVSWADPCDPPSNDSDLENGSFYILPRLKLTITKEDVLSVAAVVVDEYDRETIHVGDYLVWDSEQDALMWPQSGSWSYGNSPDDWTY